MKYPTKFLNLLRDIRSLKIQGAEAVSLAGKEALLLYYNSLKKSKKTPKQIYSLLKSSNHLIASTRPTEPMLRNVCSYILKNLDIKNLDDDIQARFNYVDKHFKISDSRIIEYGQHKIKPGMKVFTHCHSSTVTKILIKAKKNKKNFIVNNTETRPLYQGRKTAKELSKNNIHVEHYVDSAAKLAIKDSDIVLLGADAITTDGVFNKIGSEMFAMVAHHYDVPVFICSNSWKFDNASFFGFDEKIEKRHAREVWQNHPKKVHINNHAFEKINPEFITGIISEIGVLPYELFISHAVEEYNFLKYPKL